MRTLGIDLSVQPKKTAMATILWDDGAALVEDLTAEVDDDDLVEAIGAAEFCGIDSPLGWPRAMAAAVAAHSRGDLWQAPTKDEFRHRLTDRVVIERTKTWGGRSLHPLSVAADRIALPAWRIAGVRHRVAERTGRPPFDLAGESGVYEVYPAAGLLRWDLSRKGYKRTDAEGRERRGELVRLISKRADWLDWGDAKGECVETDDALDAVIAALITRAAAMGRTLRPTDDQIDAARAEGWIHLPEVNLEDLSA